jgi:mannose-6-phosphate isomerase-like protein (cupin superfamily)
MPQPGQEIKRANGYVLRIVALDAGLLEMEAHYRGDEPLAQLHLHPHQDEHFEVLEGKMHTVIGDVENHYGEGDVFDVPAGTPHQMAAEGPTRMRWQIRPALRTAEFFERLYAALDNGFPAGTTAEDFLAEFSDEFRLVAAPEA